MILDGIFLAEISGYSERNLFVTKILTEVNYCGNMNKKLDKKLFHKWNKKKTIRNATYEN